MIQERIHLNEIVLAMNVSSVAHVRNIHHQYNLQYNLSVTIYLMPYFDRLMANTVWFSLFKHNIGNVTACLNLALVGMKQAIAGADFRALEDLYYFAAYLYISKASYAEALHYITVGDAVAVKRGSYATHALILSAKARLFSLTERLDDALRVTHEAQLLIKKYNVKDYSVQMVRLIRIAILEIILEIQYNLLVDLLNLCRLFMALLH
jgi:hypothetical protein